MGGPNDAVSGNAQLLADSGAGLTVIVGLLKLGIAASGSASVPYDP